MSLHHRFHDVPVGLAAAAQIPIIFEPEADCRHATEAVLPAGQQDRHGDSRG